MAWWYSQDEEQYNGPMVSREDAIAQGVADYDNEPFLIVEAEQGSYNLDFNDNTLLEMFDGQNEDNSGPEGEHTFSDKLTTAQVAVLVERLNETVRKWVRDHNIDTTAWAFTDMETPETITPETVTRDWRY